ncbi:hypothetical protein HK097_001870 [Rhizophlyctis rosea]|uniref:Protein farnesyltransferase/geranylgeranyltransferase type-1 subunit alpha n=1 Tax=Rhizophlyctis rosea TaxID=64517 RepID=A0AAD5S427_9FUNG|nr:hypothetical protein HK097_001870 [Rhizophlyctis rosea]
MRSARQYRQEILAALQKDLKEELDFIDDMASEHPKSYQIWHHRQIIIERLNDPSKEISFIDKMLALDSKNYHAWSYRQWVVSTYNLWDDEIPDIDRLIVEDIRNNSAWNQRFFVMSRRPQGFGEDDIVKEVSYILQKIRLAPNNESPWNYLRGILEFAGKPFDEFPQIEDVCRSFEAKAMIVPHALNFLLELNAQQVQAGQGERVAECEKISKQLEEHDPVRKLYWRHRLEQVKAFRN